MAEDFDEEILEDSDEELAEDSDEDVLDKNIPELQEESQEEQPVEFPDREAAIAINSAQSKTEKHEQEQEVE